MNMKNQFLMFVMLSSLIKGVLHEEEQKTVDETLSVMEGENATLGSGITNIQNNDRIVWIYENTRIAQMNVEPGKISVYDGDRGVFHNKLQLNSETGDLTITYIITYHTGVYQLENLNSGTSKRFMVNVTRLPVPVISKNTSSSSSVSKCVLLCSVMNVTHVSLSWYKGNSLLSSISVSDLNIRLSLHLEVEYQDTNTYTCVINNPITNQTQHLDINELCQCSELSGVSEDVLPSHLTILMGAIVVAALVVGAVLMIFCIYKRWKKTDQLGQTSKEEHMELNGVSADAECSKRKTVTDGVKYIQVKAGDPVKLDTGVTDVQRFDLIQWKFGKLGDKTSPFFPISRINKNNEESLKNDVITKLGDRLKVIGETGSITIENSKTTDTGFYKLEIDSRTDQICKSFLVTVSE